MASSGLTLVGDFETTVFKGQKTTQVWASALVPMGSEEVKIFGSIDDTFRYLCSLKSDILIYYHNLKFDGSFWLDFFLKKLEWEQALNFYALEKGEYKWVKTKWMESKTFKYAISDTGNWYNFIIKVGKHSIELRDSLKLLPFSVEKIGKSFQTKHKKLDMKYEGLRYPGCTITEKEKEYISNDVLVIKEALEIMYEQGHTKMTIGSCCMSEFKKSLESNTTFDYKELFPDLYEIAIDYEKYGSHNADEFIRKSYKGGWSYLVSGKGLRLLMTGFTADVNSLYPSVMHSSSGNYYPVGSPYFWEGEIPEEALKPGRYYFVRIRTYFDLKEAKLPFIQIKNSLSYKGNENLTTSDVWLDREEKYVRNWVDEDGTEHTTKRELTLTCTDFELVKEHYVLSNLEILGGCWFYAEKGIFDDYIDKYAEIKMTSKGAVRELAKLFLNNLYGKLAASKVSSFKVAYIKPDGQIGFRTQHEEEKLPGYIAAGSAVTSYARNFTIRAAQKNYYGPDKPGFVYADTDSIHCDLDPSEVKGIVVHPTNFNCWKLESYWDFGWFVRQKTYVEHVTHEDGEPVEAYYNMKCAGLPKNCKNLFIASIQKDLGGVSIDDLSEEERDFLFHKDGSWKERSLQDFRVGIVIPGKLKATRIDGGVLLVPGPYQMH